MPSWLSNLVGTDLAGPASVLLAAAIVIGLLVLVIWVAKKALGGSIGVRGKGRGPRLAVMDVTAVDQKRKLVLVRRDEVEHLLLIGGQNDLVVEASILRIPAAARARAEQSARMEPSPIEGQTRIEGQARVAQAGPRAVRDEPSMAARAADGRTASPLARPVPRPSTQRVAEAVGNRGSETRAEAPRMPEIVVPEAAVLAPIPLAEAVTVQTPETIVKPARSASDVPQASVFTPIEPPRAPQQAPDIAPPVELPVRTPASFAPPPPVMPPRQFQAGLKSQRPPIVPPLPEQPSPAEMEAKPAPSPFVSVTPPQARDEGRRAALLPAFAPILGQNRSMATPTLPQKVTASEVRTIVPADVETDIDEDDVDRGVSEALEIDREKPSTEQLSSPQETAETMMATDSRETDGGVPPAAATETPEEQPTRDAEPVVSPARKPFPWRPASLPATVSSAASVNEPLSTSPSSSAEPEASAPSESKPRQGLAAILGARSSPTLPRPPRQTPPTASEPDKAEATDTASIAASSPDMGSDTAIEAPNAPFGDDTVRGDEDRNDRRPLSVRSFATAIQARKGIEARPEQKLASPPPPFVRTNAPVSPASAAETPAPRRTAAGHETNPSVGMEDLLSAELDSSLRSTDWGDVDKTPPVEEQPKPATAPAEPPAAVEQPPAARPLTLEEEMERLLGDFDFEFSDRKSK